MFIPPSSDEPNSTLANYGLHDPKAGLSQFGAPSEGNS